MSTATTITMRLKTLAPIGVPYPQLSPVEQMLCAEIDQLKCDMHALKHAKDSA